MGYEVDWNDPPYPQIVRHEGEEGETLTKAKQEIIQHAQDAIRHWKAIIKRTRELRIRDIETTLNGEER